MYPRLFIDIDPRRLHLPMTRVSGADPYKLHQQTARYGQSIEGMPPLEVYGDCDGEFVIYNGVTRATRAAIHHPGQLITIEVVGYQKQSVSLLPTLGSLLP